MHRAASSACLSLALHLWSSWVLRSQPDLPQVHADGVRAQEGVVQGSEQLLIVVLIYTGGEAMGERECSLAFH